MFKKIKLFLLFFIISTFLYSCQKTESLDEIVFDNSLLGSLAINAEKKEIIVSYEANLSEPYIDHVMENSPTKRIILWAEDNISNFGTMNKLVVNISNASIIRGEIETEKKVAGVNKKQSEYIYKINIVIDFVLYNDDNQIVSTSKTEVNRSTTSSKFISLNERNRILDNLTLESLKDLSKKSVELLKIHMSEYVL